MQIRSLCVFCGSSFGSSSAYRDKTIELGRYLAEKDITLIYGGGGVGLMGVLAGTVIDSGGRAVGVIPELINGKVEHIEGVETIITDDMHSRKQKMYELSDAFAALPGGIGTVEELSEVFTWQQLGYHSKAVSLYNINNFYDGFIEFLGTACIEGFLKEVHRSRLIVEDNPRKLLHSLENFSGGTVDKWS